MIPEPELSSIPENMIFLAFDRGDIFGCLGDFEGDFDSSTVVALLLLGIALLRTVCLANLLIADAFRSR